jgi:hypothetical protein
MSWLQTVAVLGFSLTRHPPVVRTPVQVEPPDRTRRLSVLNDEDCKASCDTGHDAECDQADSSGDYTESCDLHPVSSCDSECFYPSPPPLAPWTENGTYPAPPPPPETPNEALAALTVFTIVFVILVLVCCCACNSFRHKGRRDYFLSYWCCCLLPCYDEDGERVSTMEVDGRNTMIPSVSGLKT